MDAVLTPHRSLSFAAFCLLLLVFAAMNAAIAIFFVAQGAYPVAGFLGLDVIAFVLAFYLNYRAARREERVRVAADHIHLARRADAHAAHWVVSPAWARVRQDADGVRIVAGGGSMRVASFLSPKERSAFAAALSEALWRANHSANTSRIE